MTAYNGMYRCEGSQQKPKTLIHTTQGIFVECPVCRKFCRRYTNGKVVMHKRKVRD